MTKIDNDKLLSHRIRGFSIYESSIASLKNALESEVLHIEVDIRLTKDEVFVVAHDPYYQTKYGNILNYSDTTLDEVLKNHATPIVTLESFLHHFNKQSKNQSRCKLHIDVKFFGYEKKLLSLLTEYLPNKNFYIVSWLPEVLIKVHEIEPTAPLCLSYIPIAKPWFYLSRLFINNKSILMLNLMIKPFRKYSSRLLNSIDLRYVSHSRNTVSFTKNTICVFPRTPDSNLLKIIKSTGGYVCIPKEFLSNSLIQELKSHYISSATFSVLDRSELSKIEKKYQLDLYYCDFNFMISD